MPAGAEFAWAAFVRLHADRPRYAVVRTYDIKAAGMGAVPLVATELQGGRIPFASIDRYARRYRVEGSGFDVLVALIDALDNEYLAWESEKAKERAAAQG